MRKNDPVSHVMSKDVVTINAHAPISKARQLMESAEVHHLPVVEEGELVGLLSWTDMLRISFGEFGNQTHSSVDAVLDHTYKLNDVMQANPVTISESGTVREAAQILGTHNFHSLPVVNGTTLVGIITSTDLIQYLMEQY